MTLSHPPLRVGDPLRLNAVSVFPLFCESEALVDYRLADDALADESLLVEEISEGGSVPELCVENRGDIRVLFIEGEELVGAKQNRILNTTVLVPANTRMKIPVSCVEQGRWRYQSRKFGSSGSQSPSTLRRELKRTVGDSARAKRGHRSDQGEIWKKVGELHAELKLCSNSGAMSDAFDSVKDRLEEFRDKLKYVDGASGMAIAVGKRIISVDSFDKPSTCEKVWRRLLSGIFFEASREGEVTEFASKADIEGFLESTYELDWAQTEAVGEGEEYRAQSERGDQASALAFADTVVHESAVAAAT